MAIEQGHYAELVFFGNNSQTMLIEVLIAVLVPISIVAFPAWPWSRKWGYSPSVGITAIALILFTLLRLYIV